MGFGYFMYSHSLVPVIDLLFSGRDKGFLEYTIDGDVNAQAKLKYHVS